MFGKKKRPPPPKGQGAAAAKQMGLFLDLDPEQMAVDENLDDPDLEAELAAITGNKSAAGGRTKNKGKSLVPMEDIARMADECMRDVDNDEDDSSLEDDEDLLAELQEVVGEAEDGESFSSSSPSATTKSLPGTTPELSSLQTVKVSSAAPGSLQQTLEDRITMYKTALENAKAAGESSKARRYDRGLKTLQSMLTTVKKGRAVDEAEIPPPVATGASRVAPRPTSSEQSPPSTSSKSSPSDQLPASIPDSVTPSSDEGHSSSLIPAASDPPSPEETVGQTAEEPGQQQQQQTDAANEETKALLVERQREYKVAALRAKKQGDLEQARFYLKISKKFDGVMAALENGLAVDLSGLPPSPSQNTQGDSVPVKGPPAVQNVQVTQPAADAPAPNPPAAPTAPKDALEALEQRRAKYQEMSSQAKANGDDRKARMHDRIAKQYQSAIRAHKAGKEVNFDELPVPPGFPPIPGQKAADAGQGFVAALMAVDKLISNENVEAADEDDDEEEKSKPAAPQEPRRPTLIVPRGAEGRKRSPSTSPDRSVNSEGLSPAAAEQLEFLENRKKQYLKAALQAKQKNDLELAKSHLRTSKGLDAMIGAVRSGKPVDTSKVPSPPGDEDGDFILVHHSDVQQSEKTEEVYAHLMKILKEQYEKCMTHSKQFTHLGNVNETTKFERMAETCKKSLEVLKLSQSRGLPPPKHHFEERPFHTVRMFPELSSTDMVIVIVKGMNLPAPNGVQPSDLDAYIKFDFLYPSSEQPQRHKTAVVKNTNSPEYNQSFTLAINRNHRGFKRVVTSRGIKLELLHKGGFLRSDKPIGTAQIKLDKLETQSEIREIVEVMDGRKPTGGRVEVKVRLREPLSGQDTQTSTERWLVIDHS